MQVIKPSVCIASDVDGVAMLKRIEQAGRTCYRSLDKVSETSYVGFVRRLIDLGHDSVLEHESVSVVLTCDRAIANEIVRHRIGSYCQESTRYCRYGSGESSAQELTFISPFAEGTVEYALWLEAMERAEKAYVNLLGAGADAEMARGVLPLSLGTNIYITYNLRQWRHFLEVRTSQGAHPQMREIAFLILRDLRLRVPVVFDDLPKEADS